MREVTILVVMSMKWTLKKVGIVFGVVLVVAVALALIFSSNGEGGFDGETQEQRINFLASLGLEADPESERAKEVVIPEEFDEIFENYNALQKKAGFDLENFKGKTVKKYTYKILNYPSAEKDDIILSDLLVFDGKIIGGDVYAPRLDGFITGLEEVKDAT